MGLSVLVTVGMGPWPFDRLLEALDPVCQCHEVFAQTGISRIEPPCPSSPFVPYGELAERIAAADVVVCHAGNTVRLVQRADKVPIAVARRRSYGEMANDHQVAFLRHEANCGRVVAVADVTTLGDHVTGHPTVEPVILARRPPPPKLDGQALADRLDEIVGNLTSTKRRSRLRPPG